MGVIHSFRPIIVHINQITKDSDPPHFILVLQILVKSTTRCKKKTSMFFLFNLMVPNPQK